MIDFHAHVLPGIDDGSKGVCESMKMLNFSRQQGVKCVVATPHFYPWKETPEAFLKRRDIACAALSRIAVPLLIGAEVAYYDGIEDSLNISSLKIVGTHFILIEMPMLRWTKRMLDSLHSIEHHTKLKVVLAHVDRYIDLQKGTTNIDYVCNHFLIQINANYFIDRRTQRKAIKLITRGHIDFIGSDCHNMTLRQPNVGEACQYIQKKLGVEWLSSFFYKQRTYLS